MTVMIGEKGRNYLIANVELNWARLATPVSPFGTAQYELQIATTDEAVANEWRANHLTVKADKKNEGTFVVSLKRKATKADGSDMGAPRVVDAAKAAVDASKLGNGSRGNVIVRQYNYDTMGRSGVATMLEAVQVTDFVEFVATGGVDFDIVGGETPAGEEQSSDLF